MTRASTRNPDSKIDKRGFRVLQQTAKVSRFKSSRQAKALIDAIKYGDSNLAIWLLKHRVDPTARDRKRRPALWHAARWCRANVIRELVKRGASLPDDVLMGPVHQKDEKTVRFLVERGANVNCVARYTGGGGWFHPRQILLTTAIGQPESIAIMLIRAGARVNQLILAEPFAGTQNRSILGLAAYLGLLKTVRAMIAAGADVNMRDNSGGTALMDALAGGHLSVAMTLLNAGARADVRANDGRTPASVANERALKVPGIA